MKLKGRLLMTLIGIFSFLSGCFGYTDKNATEFEWHATDSAPKGYPMEIRQGSFFIMTKVEAFIFLQVQLYGVAGASTYQDMWLALD